MSEIEQFLAVNGLKQIELANFLGLNKSTISQVVSGKARLSQGKINQLRMNDKGWDCSMFPDAHIVQTIGNHSPYAGINCNNTELVENLRSQIANLQEIIRNKDTQIDRLIKLLESK